MGIIMEINTRGQVNSIYLVKKAQMGDKKAIEDIVARFTPFIQKFRT
jgi:hypothetical protein